MSNPSTKNAYEQLINRLLANLPANYSDSRVKLPNRSFTTPSNDKWMRPTVIIQDADNVQAGGKWKRFDFLFVVDLFIPVGEDVLATLTDAESIAATFENQKFSGVNCQEALITDNQEDNSWYNVQIEIDGYFEGVPA